MRRVVLHPSAFVDWFACDDSEGLRADFEAGQLGVIVPTSFAADTMGLLAARGWPADRIEQTAAEVRRIGFRFTEPPASELAMWLARGLSVSAASYAALASWLDIPVAVKDEELGRALRTLPQA